MIRDIIDKYYNDEEINKEDKNHLFSYLRHIPNIKKTEKEWDVYKKMANEKGIENLDRNSKVRPLHEK